MTGQPVHETFAMALRDEPSLRFTEWLRRRAQPAWDAATDHRFTRQLGQDALPDEVWVRYLVQDYAFVGTLTRLVATAVAAAPTLTAQRELIRFLGVLTSEENDYFERCFDALGVTPRERTAPTMAPTTRAFAAFMEEVAAGGDYGRMMAVLVAAEWDYLAWARREAAHAPPARFWLAQWIDLHATPAFERFVDGFLRGELDRLGPHAAPVEQEALADRFAHALRLEAEFFEQAYTPE